MEPLPPKCTAGSYRAVLPLPACGRPVCCWGLWPLRSPFCPALLQEATGLSSLFQRVDDLFAAGDPARVAEALAGMRRGLAVVGDSVQVGGWVAVGDPVRVGGWVEAGVVYGWVG